MDVVTSNRSVDRFSRLVSIDEIRRNDYNLNIPRYVDSSEDAETWDVYASMFGGAPKKEVDALHEYWQAWPSLKDELYTDDGGSCLTCRTDDIVATIRNNADVKAYAQHYAQAIAGLPAMLRDRLVNDAEHVDALSAEAEIGGELDTMLATCPLVDPYDAYQELDDAWKIIEPDLEIIQSEGFAAVNKVDPNMVMKKKNGKDVEVQDGWAGRILPFDLVQKELLSYDLQDIDADEERMQSIQTELDEMLSNFDEEEKSITAINEDGDAFVAAELKRTVKVIGKHPSNEFEERLVHAQQLLDESKKLKSAVKTKRTALEEKTRSTVESLDEQTARAMLEAKWITPLMKKIKALPEAVIAGFISRVSTLNTKYETTYADVCNQIAESERELASMIGQLTGNEADMAGLAELQSLLGGE